uniref:Uncharacterized protein n=1 Tax=Lepeophtheirus salmonis TaxID=72036 RepID=A0A0K2TN62_LEPSM
MFGLVRRLDLRQIFFFYIKSFVIFLDRYFSSDHFDIFVLAYELSSKKK